MSNCNNCKFYVSESWDGCPDCVCDKCRDRNDNLAVELFSKKKCKGFSPIYYEPGNPRVIYDENIDPFTIEVKLTLDELENIIRWGTKDESVDGKKPNDKLKEKKRMSG